MTALTDEVRAALIAGRLGHLVTINSDGSPQVSAVWIGLEGHKITNIARDPSVAPRRPGMSEPKVPDLTAKQRGGEERRDPPLPLGGMRGEGCGVLGVGCDPQLDGPG